MNIFEELKKLGKSGEKSLAFDPVSGDVLSTDIVHFEASSGKTANLSLVFDAKSDADVYFVISAAMGRPGNMIESECQFKGSPIHLRVVYHPSPAPRVLVFIKPR